MNRINFWAPTYLSLLKTRDASVLNIVSFVVKSVFEMPSYLKQTHRVTIPSPKRCAPEVPIVIASMMCIIKIRITSSN